MECIHIRTCPALELGLVSLFVLLHLPITTLHPHSLVCLVVAMFGCVFYLLKMEVSSEELKNLASQTLSILQREQLQYN